MATAIQRKAPPENSLVLYNISWEEYVRMGRILADRPLRMTYDRGTLEIMTLGPEHERSKHVLRRLVETLSDERDIRIAGFGSMTCKRRKKKRGFEPDECYWVANAAAVWGKVRIDLRVDPPPDLSIEVDVSNSSLDRMPIYAALGVVEVWRLTTQKLVFNQLQADGKYAEIPTSLAFPALTAADLMPFLQMGLRQDEFDMLKAFRAWIRERFGQSPVLP